jgi:hypothetical protein
MTAQAPAVAGDFASANPWYSYDAGPGGLIAGSSGLTIGAFAWVTVAQIDFDSSPAIANSFAASNITLGTNQVSGFVHRAQQGLNTTFLADASMQLPKGMFCDIATGGDFWVVNNGTTQALPGQKTYAFLGTGLASFAATGSASTGSATGSTIAASTFSVTGSIVNNTLTVTAVTSGTIVAGAVISGGSIVTGTQIVSQLSGTAGGVGVYAITPTEQTIASLTISGTYGTLTIGTPTGTVVVGALVTGGGTSAGTYVTQFLTGSGGAGTYAVNNTQTVASATLTWTTNVETSWYCRSFGAVGELVKISNVPTIG